MKNLIYFTIGYNKKFIDLLDLCLKSYYFHNDSKNTDILIILDKSLQSYIVDIYNKYTNLMIKTCKDSSSPMDASMQKINIFNYIQDDEYGTVLYIDSDILINSNLDNIIAKITNKELLYIGIERDDPEEHRNMFWSLNGIYTNEDINFFKTNNINVFNAGCFGFVYSESMKKHFSNLISLIHTYKGEYFYEQAFMNTYFNRLNITYNLFNTECYKLHPKVNTKYEQAIIHFCGCQEGQTKYDIMTNYIHNFMSFIKTKMGLKVFILHYTPLVERKIHILSQVNKYNFHHTFIEDEEILHDGILKEKLFTEITNTEISIFVKHINTWKEIVKNNDNNNYFLILEDDVVFDENFETKLNNYINQIPHNFDMVFIGECCNIHISPELLSENVNIYKSTGSRCADSYLISKKCCIKLLNQLHKNIINKQVDHWFNDMRNLFKLNFYFAEPTIVRQGSEIGVFNSSIR